MRLLGVGLSGAEKFCAFMDSNRPIFQSFYDKIVSYIPVAARNVAKLSIKNTEKEETRLTEEATGHKNPGLTVSGDGSWMK